MQRISLTGSYGLATWFIYLFITYKNHFSNCLIVFGCVRISKMISFSGTTNTRFEQQNYVTTYKLCSAHWHILQPSQEILDKFRQIVYKSSSLEPIANAYVEINKAISEISNHNLLGVTNYLIVYESTLSMSNSNNQEHIIKYLAKKSIVKSFLAIFQFRSSEILKYSWRLVHSIEIKRWTVLVTCLIQMAI